MVLVDLVWVDDVFIVVVCVFDVYCVYFVDVYFVYCVCEMVQQCMCVVGNFLFVCVVGDFYDDMLLFVDMFVIVQLVVFVLLEVFGVVDVIDVYFVVECLCDDVFILFVDGIGEVMFVMEIMVGLYSVVSWY